MQSTKRQTELDILRLLAILAVIAIHSGGHTDISIANISFSRHVIVAALVWCVPVFFMISGRFFLDPGRNVSLKKILTKYVPHIAVAFLLWSAVYTVYYKLTGSYDGLNTFGVLSQFIEGPYHFWYLYTLIGLYLITPFLRKIAENDELLVYFLILFAALNVTFEYLIYLPKIGGVIRSFAEKFNLDMLTGYVGYFMLGYLLWHIKDKISKRWEIAIYAVGAVMLVGTVAAEALVSPELRDTDFVKQYMKPNVVIFSSAIYLFFIKRLSRIEYSEKTVKIFAFLTEMGFGVYCVHAIVNELMPGSLQVVRVICIYLASLAVTYLIRKVPYIGKKIT